MELLNLHKKTSPLSPPFKKKKKKEKNDLKTILRMTALFLVLEGGDNRLMILVLPSVKNSSSSMPQAAQMTSGKTLPCR